VQVARMINMNSFSTHSRPYSNALRHEKDSPMREQIKMGTMEIAFGLFLFAVLVVFCCFG
jgi:hypothetical protein